MINANKTTGQLITELSVLRERICKLEESEAKQNGIRCALEDSELRYRRLFETAQDGILILDKSTGQIIDVNPFLINMLGYSKNEFLGKQLWEIGPFKNKEASKVAFQELQEKEYIRYENLPLETRDKRLISVEFVSNVYSIDHMKVIQCNVRDITDRKRVEAKLAQYREHLNELVEERTTELKSVNESLEALLAKHKETENALTMSEEKYRLLVETANEGITVSQDAMFKFVNRRAEEITGYSKEELLSMHIVDNIYPDDKAKVMERYQQRLKGEDPPVTYDLRIVTKRGSIRWIEINAVLMNWQGSPAILSFMNDITDRKEAEHQILEDKALLQTVIDSNPDRIAVKDSMHRYLLVNKSLADALNLKSKEIIGKFDTDMYTQEQILGNPEKGVRSIHDDDDAAMNGRTIRVVGTTGDIYGALQVFDIYRAPLKDSDGNIYGVLDCSRDITELYNAVEELKKSYQKAQKLLDETVEAIAAIGEIRDPYTAGHQTRVTQLACAIAAEIGLPEDTISNIKTGGTLHDIGKLCVPAEILSKPGKLSELEFSIIKSHPQVGYDIIKRIEFPDAVAQMIVQHHERLDGSGYPYGLSDRDIIIEAKIIAVADVVEAMSSHRPYRPALGIEKAIDEINMNKGTLYDETVVDICTRLFKEKRFKFD